MARYAGFCSEEISEPTQWGPGDVIGSLLVEEASGWYLAGSHYSSSVLYARQDVQRLFERVKEDGDTYEWVGQISADEAEERFPVGPLSAIPMPEARRRLYEAIGLSQSQFANPDGDGLDSAALIAAVDEYTESIATAHDAPVEALREALRHENTHPADPKSFVPEWVLNAEAALRLAGAPE